MLKCVPVDGEHLGVGDDVHQEGRVRGWKAFWEEPLANGNSQLVHVVAADASASEERVGNLPAAEHRPPRFVAQALAGRSAPCGGLPGDHRWVAGGVAVRRRQCPRPP